MIALLKVYETLYQNDVHEILYVMIIKSKFSDNFVKNVLLPYLEGKDMLLGLNVIVNLVHET